MSISSPFLPSLPVSPSKPGYSPRRTRNLSSYSKTHDNYFAIADALSVILKKHEKVLNSPPYNYMIHTTPVEMIDSPYYHWHIEIIPRLTKMAGFEWGTGFYINPTPPEEATIYLQEADV